MSTNTRDKGKDRRTHHDPHSFATITHANPDMIERTFADLTCGTLMLTAHWPQAGKIRAEKLWSLKHRDE